MSDRAATILAAAIVIAGLLYFAVHLHNSTHGANSAIYNTVTGQYSTSRCRDAPATGRERQCSG